MAKNFNVAQIAEEEAITVTLRDGTELRAKELLPEVVDGLGLVVDARAREEAEEEVLRRRLFATLGDENADDDAYAKASADLTQLTTKSAQRGRLVAYEQLAKVFAGPDEKTLTVKFLQAQIPLPVATRIADELTRQILGRKDAESGNAEGSEPAPTPTGSTS